MASTDLAVRIATILDATGLNKADKALKKFDKTASKLGKTLGVSLGSAALVVFGKSAVTAFTDAERANTRLAGVVKNLGLAFEQAKIQAFLDDISASAGIAGEVLVDAFQPLLTATGSVIKSQEMLKQALDISAGAGVDLVTASNDLAQAYVGNTKGLRKYNLGLTKNELSALSYTKASQLLNKQFSGAQAAYLETYAGKMQVLGEAAGNAAETIGGSLIDALMAVSNSSTTGDLVKGIEKITGYVTGLIDSVAFAIFSIKSLFNTKYWKSGGGDQIFKDFEKLMNARNVASARPYDPANNAVTGYQRDNAARIQAEADAKKRAKALLDAQKKNTAELKKQALAKKQSALFDLQQIGIIAALKGKLSDEDRKRLELQLAIITDNTTEADRLSKEIANSIDKTGNLAKYLTTLPDANNPFKNWDAFLDAMIAKAKEAAALFNAPPPIPQPSNLPETVYNPNTYVPSSGYVPPTNVEPIPTPSNLPNTEYNQGTYVPSSGYMGAQSIVVQIDGKEIANAVVGQQMNGNNAYLNRRLNGFD